MVSVQVKPLIAWSDRLGEGVLRKGPLLKATTDISTTLVEVIVRVK